MLTNNSNLIYKGITVEDLRDYRNGLTIFTIDENDEYDKLYVDDDDNFLRIESLSLSTLSDYVRANDFEFVGLRNGRFGWHYLYKRGFVNVTIYPIKYGLGFRAIMWMDNIIVYPHEFVSVH